MPTEISRAAFFKIDVRSLFGFVVSGFFLWLLVKQSSLEWKQLQQAVNSSHTVVYLFVSTMLALAFIYIQSLRTRIIFIDHHTTIRHIKAYPSLVIGYFYNSVLPGNLGEAVRVWHFSRANKKSLSATTAMVALEKILDANLLIPIIVLTIFSIPFQGNYFAHSLAFILVGIILIDVILVILTNNKKFNRLVFALIWKKRIRIFFFKVYIHYIYHLQRLWLNNTLKWYALVAYSMFLVNGLQHFAVLKALNIPTAMLDVTTFNLLNLCMAIVAFIPAAPSNLGVAHYAIYTTLLFSSQINGLQPNHSQFALAAICIHFSYFIPDVLLGFVYLVKERTLLFGK